MRNADAHHSLTADAPCLAFGRSAAAALGGAHSHGAGLAATSAPSPAATPEDAAVPRSFATGRYQVQRFLGEGHENRLYLAHDTRLARPVDGTLPQPLVATISRKTESNPFFLNALLGLLLTDGCLNRLEAMGCRSLIIPQEVREVINSRLERYTSRQLTNTAVQVTGACVRIFGTATVNGTRSFDFRVEVCDASEPGAGTDTFAIFVTDGYMASGTLSGGNIQIH